MLTKEDLISTYHSVFSSPIDFLPGDVHFELEEHCDPGAEHPQKRLSGSQGSH